MLKLTTVIHFQFFVKVTGGYWRGAKELHLTLELWAAEPGNYKHFN